MRVLLPAPFSPQIAWTSRRSRSKETPSRARTPGKSLVIDLSSSSATSGSGRRRPHYAERHVLAAGDARARAFEARETLQRAAGLARRDAAVERVEWQADQLFQGGVLAQRRPGRRIVDDESVDAPALEAVQGLLLRDAQRAFPQSDALSRGVRSIPVNDRLEMVRRVVHLPGLAAEGVLAVGRHLGQSVHGLRREPAVDRRHVVTDGDGGGERGEGARRAPAPPGPPPRPAAGPLRER